MPYPTWALLSLLPLISSPTQEKPSQEKTVRANVVLLLDDKSASFVTPFATAADPKSGEIYIADQEGNAVFVFAENGREKAKLAVPAPMGVTLDRSGQIYVLNTKGEIAIYDFQGRKIGDLVPTGLPQDAAKPQPLQIMMGDKDDLFIADGANQAVLMLDSKGKFQRAFGTIGTKAKGPRFKGLKSFCVGRNKVYVIDGNTSQVSVFSRTSGDLLFSFGESGGSHLQLAVPVSITVDKEGRVYVLDSLRHCITIFNEEGQPIGECGGQGRSPGWFYFPKSIARDAKGRFYVCDTALKRVQVFTIPVEELEKPREAKGK